jgi:altronate dehydratase large subunit
VAAGKASSKKSAPKSGRGAGLTFSGFRRPSGGPGARNHLAVISVMDNSNPIVRRICSLRKDLVGVNTSFGRALYDDDQNQHFRVMGHLAGHPNVGAAIIIGLEPKTSGAIAEVAAKASPWMPIEIVTVHETGGTLKMTSKAMELADKLSRHLSAARRKRCELGEITLGTECGGSDTTSGLVSNPVTGMVADRVIDEGGRVIFSETLEIVGAEHLLARRAADAKTKRRILACVKRTLDYAESLGVDLIGSNPTDDNIAGGLSSIEEKSLGAVKKGGSRPIVEVIGVGERPSRRGTVFADAPCGGVENITSLASSGAQVIIFSTGIGNPVGHPISPTIKVTGNPRTAAHMAENIDINLRGVMEGGMSYDEAAERLLGELTDVLSGKLTTSELLGETEVTVSRAALNG